MVWFEKKDRTPATEPVRREIVKAAWGSSIEIWMDADDEQVWLVGEKPG